jgi:hypothetical protein
MFWDIFFYDLLKDNLAKRERESKGLKKNGRYEKWLLCLGREKNRRVDKAMDGEALDELGRLDLEYFYRSGFEKTKLNEVHVRAKSTRQSLCVRKDKEFRRIKIWCNT